MYTSYKTKEEFVTTTEGSARIQLESSVRPTQTINASGCACSGRRDRAEAHFKVSIHSNFPFSAANIQRAMMDTYVAGTRSSSFVDVHEIADWNLKGPGDTMLRRSNCEEHG